MKKFIFIFCAVLAVNMCGCNQRYDKDMPEETENVAGGTDYDNAKIAWGFKKIKGSPPEVPSSWSELLHRFDGYYLGNTEGKNLYLTFDEGYENGYTGQILDVLKKTGTPAAFFVTGPYLNRESALVKRMVDEGHIVGNHTVNHPSMPEVMDETKLLKELNDLSEKFKQMTGQDMTYLRPPKGEFSERTLALSKKAGYKTVLWSSAYADWDVNKQHGVRYAVEKVTEQFHDGSIILLHAVSKDNANALEEIINTAKNQGYTFLSLNDL